MLTSTKILQIALVALAVVAPMPVPLIILAYCLYRMNLELKSKDKSNV